MAIINTSSFNFAEVVEKYLLNYHQECVEAMTESINEVSKEAVRKLRATSPGKHYPKRWARRIDGGRIKYGVTIYSRTPGLPHLLEKGHAKRNGGRTRAIVHIAPVEAWAVDEVFDRIIEKMEAAP